MILRRLNNLVPRSNFRAPYLYHRFSYRKSDYTIGKLGASSLIYIFRYLQQDKNRWSYDSFTVRTQYQSLMTDAPLRASSTMFDWE